MLQALKVLRDKSKFEILSYIRDKKAYVSELAKHLNLSTATIPHHISVLINSGLVEIGMETKERVAEQRNCCYNKYNKIS